MKRTYRLPRWDFYGVLIDLGTASEISQMLVDKGYDRVPPTTIQGWRNRNLLPAPWVPVFLALALEYGIIRRIGDLELIE
jgi:hypothetical protein